jgi:hypothetical protein
MHLLRTLRARFDLDLLLPPEPWADASATLQPHDPQAWQALQAWCAAGSGPGGSPLLRPGALAAVGLAGRPLQAVLATLTARSASLAHPVRLLLLNAPGLDGAMPVIHCR